MDDNFELIEKYNFWDNKTFELGLNRETYTSKIGNYIGNRLVKVLIGQRRVGKSYILRQIAMGLIEKGIPKENILYINKEYLEYDFVEDYKHLEQIFQIYKKKLSPKGKIYLFIDEVQIISQWEKFVNSHSQDIVEECEIFISGSNSDLLSSELSTLLSGRYIQFIIYPFSFEEYSFIRGLDLDKSSYINYIQEGGFPELINLRTEDAKHNYLSSLRDSVMLKDIIQRYNVKDAKLLEDIFTYLVNNSSNFLSINNILNYFKSRQRKTSYDTIANYINYLEKTFLIHRVERYNIKGKEVISGNSKYYANDTAFKNYLYKGFGFGIGYLLENLVFLELKRAGYSVYVGSNKDKEIDFVAIKADKQIYIQVAYILTDQSTIEREYSALESIDDNYEKYVVSMDDINFPSREGIKHIQAWRINEIL